MLRVVRSPRLIVTGALVVASALVFALALPAVGQDPTGSPAPAASPQPAKSPNPGQAKKAERARQAAKVPAVAVTLTGTVGTRTDADGDTVYTLTASGTVYDLHVGPPWWWGENHPLKALAGDTVTVTGERAEGSKDVDVFTADGKTLREAGKPPWAGGWKIRRGEAPRLGPMEGRQGRREGPGQGHRPSGLGRPQGPRRRRRLNRGGAEQHQAE